MLTAHLSQSWGRFRLSLFYITVMLHYGMCHSTFILLVKQIHFNKYFISILGIILATTKQQIMCTFWTLFLTSTTQHNTTQLVPVTRPPLQTPLSGKNITRTQASSVYSRKLDHPPGPSFSQDLPQWAFAMGKWHYAVSKLDHIFLVKHDQTNYSVVW